jgi:hypothetical protein
MELTTDTRNKIYFRTENILQSSFNEGQLETALNYIECYFKTTNDQSGYDVLLRKYIRKLQELNDQLVY